MKDHIPLKEMVGTGAEGLHSLWEAFRDVLGHTPLEKFFSALTGIGFALTGWVDNTAFPVFAYVMLVVCDAILGLMVAKQDRKQTDYTLLWTGPGKKILSTAIYLFGAAVIDHITGATFVVKTVGVGVTVAMFFDAGRKYGRLTGSRIWMKIEEALGNLVPYKGDNDPGS